MGAMTFFQNKWLRRAAWSVAGLLGLWAVTWLAVPAAVKYGVEKFGSDTLGRTVTLGRADFHPWTLRLTLDDLSVASASGGKPQVHIQRILLDAALWQSLRRLAPVVDAIAIDQPTITTTYLGDGHYDFDDVLAKLNTPSDQPAGAPPSFAVYNIALKGGAVDLTDQTRTTTHTLRDLDLTLPFLSNLDSQRTIQTEPHLAFKLNGSSFDSAAQSIPFDPSRKTHARIRLDQLDLAPYLAYLPTSLPVQVQGAVLSGDLQLAFEQTPKMSVVLSGTVQADQLQIANPLGEKWLALDTLKVALDELRPLEHSVKISEITLSAPVVDLRRNAAGQLQFTAPAKTESTTKKVAATADGISASGTKDVKNDAGWTVSVAKLALGDGTLRWSDASTQPRAEVALRGMAVQASAITWPFAQPLEFNASAQVDGGGTGTAPAELKLTGTATDQEANVDATLGGLPLALAAPYLANTLEPRLSGELGADLQVHWQASGPLKVTAKQLTLDRLALGEIPAKGKVPAASLFSLRQLQVSQAVVDVPAQRVQIGKLLLTEPRTKVERNTEGKWMVEQWLKAPAAAAAPADTQPGKPWAVSIADFALEGGVLSFLDQFTYQPAALDISALSVQMKDLVPGSATAQPLAVSARIGAENTRNTEPGRLTYKGTLALQPLAAVGQVDLLHLPLHALEPYFGASLNVDIVRADTSFKGQVAYTASPAGPVLKLKGDGTLEDFRANNGVGMVAMQAAAAAPAAASSAPLGAAATAAAVADASSEQALLRWKLLNLRGLDVSMSPTSPTTVDVKETALSDFYARLVLNENGRLNLQDLVKPSPAEAAATKTVAATAPSISASAPKDIKPEAEPGGAVVRFGGISLVNGRVLFTDYFIKPNYSANLSALTGRLGAFASVPVAGAVQMADLELRGRVGDSAVLEILGQLNPLAKPLALDIKSKVTDLELPSLSPYSVFYVGHGIERGKLSVDVHYVVLPNGQLTATNSIILNQLTFGEQVPGAPSSLPVKLAVALLADSNGVINLDLPLSGSLNDPQFRIGPVIFKILGNLITKAITAPFSLLAHAFGGGADALGTVNFPLGSAALDTEARAGLDKVAKALTERPTLKLTVVGSASLNAERDALQRERLQRRVEAEKRRNTVVQGAPLAAPKEDGDDNSAEALAATTVSEAEYPDLLKAIYKRANFPKPRNALGLVKDLPVPEMEQLLLANMPADEDAIRQLAVQRGVAVRDYLAAKPLPLDRLFLGASKTVDEGKGFKPQADLQLAMP